MVKGGRSYGQFFDCYGVQPRPNDQRLLVDNRYRTMLITVSSMLLPVVTDFELAL